MKKLTLTTSMLCSLAFAGMACASQPLVSDHAVGTPVAKPNVKVAGIFGTDVAIDNNSDYTLYASVEGVPLVIAPHRGKNLHFDVDYRTLNVQITYSCGSYTWGTILQTPESTALEVSVSSIVNGNPYFQVDPIFN